ncbi:CopD family protein [uncultured Microbulbifer sp.]|uniref:CopD family protein n=1 Tax=uncultured Microbulbifer sp. TaxID=348147 RepID=UPI0025ED6F38|nr:CopD family protein [uncultured Microbulbifer sp.]
MSGWEWLLVSAKFVYYTGFVALAGGLLLAMLAAPVRRQCARAIWLSVLLGIPGAILYFLFQVGSFAESGFAGLFDGAVAQMLWDTSAGALVKTRVAGLLLALPAAFALAKPGRAGLLFVWGLGLCALLIQAYAFTLTGHLSQETAAAKWTLAIHVLAAGFWIGALPLLLWLVVKSPQAVVARAMQQFGRAIGMPVVLLLVCGVYLLLRLGGDLPVTLVSVWGALLLGKLLLVGGLLSIAILNRWRLVPALNRGRSARPLTVALVIDLALAVGVLVVTGVLSTVVGPPGH